MNKYQQALYWFNGRYFISTNDKTKQYRYGAILGELVDLHIPMRPIQKFEECRYIYYCPVCDTQLCKQNYCHECGQKIKRSNVND